SSLGISGNKLNNTSPLLCCTCWESISSSVSLTKDYLLCNLVEQVLSLYLVPTLHQSCLKYAVVAVVFCTEGYTESSPVGLGSQTITSGNGQDLPFVFKFSFSS